MERLKNVLVAVDFSMYSKNALAQAMRIAQWNEANLHVIHVIQPVLGSSLADAYGVSSSGTWNTFRGVARERTLKMISAAQELNALTRQTKPTDVEVTVDVLIGNPFVHLMRRVRDVSAELLILGWKGLSETADGPGGLATKCLRKSPAKVMLVHESSGVPFRRIIACVRFSDTCRQVLQQAIRLARQDKCHLHVLHIYETPRPGPGGQAPAPETSRRLQEECAKRLHERVKDFLPPFGAEISGLKVECHPAGEGDSKGGILEFTRSAAADLVVLGTRGRTELRGERIRTTAEQVLREASCSVLAIKPDDFTYDVD